ncbi:MAG: DinB family protein [Flavobacterium sp.]|nr:DinB family protein [Flavobacterium sp.]
MLRTTEITLQNRKILQQILHRYSTDQLNTVSIGFSNNIIWNIAHTIATQQRLVYKLSGLEVNIPMEIDELYKRGTKPEHYVQQPEIDLIESLLFEPVERTLRDFNSNIFKTFTPFTTMTGFEIRNVTDAMEFNNYHEAVHLGVIMSIGKFV